MGNVRRPGGDQAATDQATGQRMSVSEAADALGISEDAVRSRIKRGTLTSVRGGGRVFVILGGQRSRDQPIDRPIDRPDESNALTSQMQGEIAYLRGQLEAERQAHAEARRLLMAALERIPAIEAPQEPSEEAETVEEEPEGAEPRPATGGAQEAVRRPWWRRVFRG
jgi:excisionase family DNA binding protein